jgi:hypothetical protein
MSLTRHAAQVATDVAAFSRYARGLRRYMSARLEIETCRQRVLEGLARREENLVRVLEDGIFANRDGPYVALCAHAAIELGDAVKLVREHGVDKALERLHDAGVYVEFDEFKGRKPIERNGLSLSVSHEDFDNPRAIAVYAGSSGGSSGPARRLRVAFAHMEQGAVYVGIGLDAHGLMNRPYGIWRPVPPGHAGLGSCLSHAKVGKLVDRWFSQYPLRRSHVREYAFTRYTLSTCRRAGIPIPTPEYVPLEQADVVARWLATQVAQGTPALLNAPGSSGVRVCKAALEHGLDISGTLFRLGGEPLTEGKAAVVAEAGASVFCNYSMSEVGRIGIGCPARSHRDEVHIVTDKLGVIQREREASGNGGPRVGRPPQGQRARQPAHRGCGRGRGREHGARGSRLRAGLP